MKDKETLIDKIIREKLIINKANLEYCAKNEIINGSLLQSIREAMEFYASEQTEKYRELIKVQHNLIMQLLRQSCDQPPTEEEKFLDKKIKQLKTELGL